MESLKADTLIVGARLIDGTGAPAVERDVAVRDGRIVAIEAPGGLSGWNADETFDAEGKVLAPGFIDVHTHDDTHVIRSPQMMPKITQGVTTVIVGNCGISASPVTLKGDPPDPMNLLGDAAAFKYPTFAAYVDAVNEARPAVNVGALIGHTALRNNHMRPRLRPRYGVSWPPGGSCRSARSTRASQWAFSFGVGWRASGRTVGGCRRSRRSWMRCTRQFAGRWVPAALW